MQKLFLAIFLLVAVFQSKAQSDFNYYFNQKVDFDKSIPTPEQILGFGVGEWLVSHDKLVEYMKAVAESSDRVSFEITGFTYEQRPLLLLTISSVENQSNIEVIKKDHLAISSSGVNLADKPVVVWLGHSIHGNEASGSNAALLMVYYLAAAQGEEIETTLKNTIILLDPSYNPDGLNRFASWVNSHKSKNLDGNTGSLEHSEAWPGGRTNHYWFDLNRDWLPVQHPESQARIKKFYEWRPNILTDQHEMGSNSTYFFQPGIPSRNNPLAPEKAFELTRKIAQYHAKAMDKIGSQYYSEESFDDYYPGKGSTFPDLNGSVGILFEQASARGHLATTENGNLSFPFAIRNHVTTSLSTLNAAQELRSELLQYQHQFIKDVKQLSANDNIKGYVFSNGNDINKANAFIKVLNQHQIAVHELEGNYSHFKSESSYLVDLAQDQYRLIKSIFEKRTSFNDSLFYDVSAWTFPLAFGMDYKEITAKEFTKIKKGKEIDKIDFEGKEVQRSTFGYLLSWEDYMAPTVLSFLQHKGIRIKVSTEQFKISGVNFGRGTCFVPVQNQSISQDKLYELIKLAASKYSVNVVGINSGVTSSVQLGSPTFRGLSTPKIAALAGNGVSSYEIGEVWHLLDQRMDIPVSMMALDQINPSNLSKYNTIIMVNGNYSKLNAKHIQEWVNNGGLIIATKRAGKWLSKSKISKVKYAESKKDSTNQRPYAKKDKYRGAQVIGGAIFDTQADLTNPLFYGYQSSSIPVFRNSTIMMERSKNAYANPLMYKSSALLSGYVSDENADKLANTAAVQIDNIGKGTVITFTDNPNFRAFWYGTNRMFLNAIFFGKEIHVN